MFSYDQVHTIVFHVSDAYGKFNDDQLILSQKSLPNTTGGIAHAWRLNRIGDTQERTLAFILNDGVLTVAKDLGGENITHSELKASQLDASSVMGLVESFFKSNP